MTYIYIFTKNSKWYVLQKRGPSLSRCNFRFWNDIPTLCGSVAV